jgi:hypothetical protein
VFVNGTVMTVNAKDEIAELLAVRGHRIRLEDLKLMIMRPYFCHSYVPIVLGDPRSH